MEIISALIQLQTLAITEAGKAYSEALDMATKALIKQEVIKAQIEALGGLEEPAGTVEAVRQILEACYIGKE